MASWDYRDISILKGKTLKSVEKIEYDGNEAIRFVVENDEAYIMGHSQDCCESVSIEDVVGDLNDLVGSPLLEAEVAISGTDDSSDYDDSYTWTFYKLGTIKGHVNIRWYGSSNGYYSESVDFWKED